MPAAKDNDAASRASETTPSVTLLVHEAAAIINLHAQAVIVQNIRSLVPLILDLSPVTTPVGGNRSSWPGSTRCRNTFSRRLRPQLSRLGSHGLRRQVSTIYTIMESGATAHATWLAIKSQFLGKCERRTLFLDAQFHNFI